MLSHSEDVFFCFFNAPATTGIYTLSLHDALPILLAGPGTAPVRGARRINAVLVAVRAMVVHAVAAGQASGHLRSEEHTSELQSRFDLVCRLLLEKKKYINLISTEHSSGCLCYGFT